MGGLLQSGKPLGLGQAGVPLKIASGFGSTLLGRCLGFVRVLRVASGGFCVGACFAAWSAVEAGERGGMRGRRCGTGCMLVSWVSRRGVCPGVSGAAGLGRRERELGLAWIAGCAWRRLRVSTWWMNLRV